MANDIERDKEAGRVEVRENNNPEISQEINSENFDEVLDGGQKKVDLIKTGAKAEIDGMEKSAEKHGIAKEQFDKLQAGRKEFEENLNDAETELKKEIKALQNENIGEKTAGKCLSCRAEIMEGAKYCTKCGVELARVEGQGENAEKMTLEEAEEFFDSIKEKAMAVSSSSESLLEKRIKILKLFSEMSKAVNERIEEADLFRTSKGKEAGNLLHEIKDDIDKNPETRKEIESTLKANGKELEKLYTSKDPEKEVREKIEEIENNNTELKLLYNELDQLGKEEEMGAKNADASHGIQQEEKNNATEEKIPMSETEIDGNEEAKKEIEDLLNDPTSELSIKTKAIKFRKGLISIAQERINKERLESVYYKERVGAHEASIAEHQAVIEKFMKEINDIKKGIIKKHGGRVIEGSGIFE